MRSTLPSVIAPMMLLACASGSQRTYVAPTSETVRSVTEEQGSNPTAHVIFVQNSSTVPITVFSVGLQRCENVRQPRCETRPVDFKVAAGSRTEVMRVTPQSQSLGFTYSFGFSWHPDSSAIAALDALAAVGDTSAQRRVTAARRSEAERRAGIRELSQDDFKALASRVASLRASPESIVVAPGERVTTDRLLLAVLDDKNQVLGHTRWARWMVNSRTSVQFVPPDNIVARVPGRSTIRFRLADDAQNLLTRTMPDVEMVIVVAYPLDPHAPVFIGRAVDADAKLPLACLRVTLLDSAQNIVTRDRTSSAGNFTLQAPRPGTYQVGAEARGWLPSYGPSQVARADEEKQGEYQVRFTDQLLATRDVADDELVHAQPISVTLVPIAAPAASAKGSAKNATTQAPIIQRVTLGGSPTMPIIGIVSRVPPGTIWIQFVVDSAGRVDPASVIAPVTAAANAKAAIGAMLARVRFSPARESGQPKCEMLRMQVNFSAR